MLVVERETQSLVTNLWTARRQMMVVVALLLLLLLFFVAHRLVHVVLHVLLMVVTSGGFVVSGWRQVEEGALRWRRRGRGLLLLLRPMVVEWLWRRSSRRMVAARFGRSLLLLLL